MDKDISFSTFGKWVGPVSSETLQEFKDDKKIDHYTKKLTTLAFLFLFVEAELKKRTGLRSIARELQANEELQRELGVTSISAGQLSRKNNQLDPSVFQTIFCDLVTKLRQMQSPQFRTVGVVKALDSTTITLNKNTFKWAAFRTTKAGVKLHLCVVVGEPGRIRLDKAVITEAKKADASQMEVLLDEKGVTYLMDRGYVDYAKFDHYCDEGIHFVSRLKDNAVVTEVGVYARHPEGSPILRDVHVILGEGKTKMRNVLRLIESKDSKGNLVRIITNHLDLPAEEIGELYRSRWQIEIIFRYLKQNLKLNHFYGTSENAVMNQIWSCLIAICLLELMALEMQLKQKKPLSELMDLLKTLLWKPFEKLVAALNREPSRSSRGRQKKCA
jgi:IS4 transposase